MGFFRNTTTGRVAFETDALDLLRADVARVGGRAAQAMAAAGLAADGMELLLAQQADILVRLERVEQAMLYTIPRKRLIPPSTGQDNAPRRSRVRLVASILFVCIMIGGYMVSRLSASSSSAFAAMETATGGIQKPVFTQETKSFAIP